MRPCRLGNGLQDKIKNFILPFMSIISITTLSSDNSAAQAALGLGSNLQEFKGISSWLNTQPLTRNDLKGKVVAIDFYTSGCSNCRAAVPHVVALYKKYRDKGLVVVGVHTPESDYERELKTVRSTATQLGIEYPIAIDNQQATWNAYQNQYWPNILIFDRQGKLVYQHAGEGSYDEIDSKVNSLL